LAEKNSGFYRELSLTETPVCRPRTEADRALAARPPLTRSLSTDWQISSFSALAALSEDDSVDLSEEPVSTGQRIAVPGLPAGAHFGNVVHELMERHDFDELRRNAGKMDLGYVCRRYGVVADQQLLAQFLFNGVDTPLFAGSSGGPVPFCLADVDSGQCIKEMAFSLYSGRVDAAGLNRILRGEPTVLPLSDFGMEGFLTGFIDLFFRHGGKYYLLDYKTNHLGDLQSSYEKEQLQAAMQSHNYGLQYWFYTVVAHRFLTNLDPGYDYQRDFGGVLYLFLRGMRNDLPGSGVFWCKPDVTVLHRLERFFGGQQDE